MEGFKDFYIYPYEFLSLICNAKNRLEVIQKHFNPNFRLQKIIFKNANNSGNANFVYRIEDEELRGDLRPNHLLNRKLEDNFYENIFTYDIGQAISNEEAGINPSRRNKQLKSEMNFGVNEKQSISHKEGGGGKDDKNVGQGKVKYELTKTNLRETLLNTRAAFISIEKNKNKHLEELKIKRNAKLMRQ